MSFDPEETEEYENQVTSNEFAADDASEVESPAEDLGDEEVAEKASGAARKLEPIVLAHVLAPKYQPVKPRVMAKQLKLPGEQHKALKLAIRRLVKRGKLSYGSGHLVRPPRSQGPGVRGQEPEARRQETGSRSGGRPTPDSRFPTPSAHGKNIVSGTFRRTASGFGFVRPQGAKRGDKTTDVYIPARSTMDAADRDLVRVRLAKHHARGRKGELRQAGEIVEIVERDTHQFVGVYKERQGTSYVDVDGKVFAQPIPVGDPGAKGAAEGDKVVIEMVRFPTHTHPGDAVITEVLGAKGAPGVDTLSIIREFGLPEEFPEDVLDDAREQAEAFDESLGESSNRRLDLTGETIITIDPVDARDFDDAVSLMRTENGHWKLGVHIADVAHFVRPRSPLDREARERGTSVYLPDRVIPMLPEVISNNLASLQPDKVRYTLSALMEFTADGAYVGCEVKRAAIKSCRRFTYEEVDDYLADAKAWREKLTPQVWSLLSRMHELAMIFRKRRLDGGSIELTLPEVKIDLDKRGEVVGAHLVTNTVSHQIIEEFMLAANEAVARMLGEAGLNFLRRIHEPPDPRKLHALTMFIRELGIECESLESRFETKRVIAQVAGQPEEHAVNYAILRSMQKAVYGPEQVGHYALNKEHYCHFTSPIRRYPDLTIHRMIETLARGKSARGGSDDFDRAVLLGEHCSEREQRAEQAERELVKVKLLMFLAKKIGSQMDAVITGVEDFGLFAQGVELPAEGLIHVDSLGDDFYRYDRVTHSLAGHRRGNRFRLGDVIRVEVAHVDVDRRELDFRIVRKVGHAGGETKSHRLPPKRGRDRRDKPERPKGGRSKKKGKRR
ncbi:MAG: ribonuclease R [Planctomycetaceae bacterium]|nr:ribonuclease R [Planctomycetaceae bacterium]